MKINKKTVFFLFLFMAFFGIGASFVAYKYAHKYVTRFIALENKFEEQSRLVSILAIGTSIDNSFLNNSDMTSAAKILCDIVYHETSKPSDQTPLVKNLSTSSNPYMVYREAIKHKNIGHTCAGHTCLLIAMLESKGIPARMAVMVKTIEHSRNSHTTVEFYNGTKWLALDPTFNTMWKRTDTNDFLPYSELYDAYKADIPVEPIFIGTEKNQRKTIENYYISTKELMGYLAVARPPFLLLKGRFIFKRK